MSLLKKFRLSFIPALAVSSAMTACSLQKNEDILPPAEGARPETAIDIGSTIEPLMCTVRATYKGNDRKTAGSWGGISALYFKCQSGGKEIILSCGSNLRNDTICNDVNDLKPH